MLIITDGESSDSVDESSTFAQSMNVTVLAIRIGYIGEREPEKLNNIVNDVDKNLILMDTFDDLPKFVKEVQERIVKAPREACW